MKKNRKKKTMIILIPLILFLLLLLPGLDNRLKVVTYRLGPETDTQPVRIALVTDLHSCAYGEGERELLDALDAQAPDLVLLGGDFFDDDLADDNSEAFLQGIRGRYPCFFVTGNHEYWSGETAFARKMAILEENGVTRLSGEMAPLEIRGMRLAVCGIDDPFAWGGDGAYTEYSEGSFEKQLAHTAALPEEGSFKILLSHRPEFFDLYSGYDFDLVLSGHAHGGQWRIPGLVNGLYAPRQGLFPAYAGGQYEKNGTVLIVSRGLARESTWLPRLYNRPELVIVEIGR